MVENMRNSSLIIMDYLVIRVIFIWILKKTNIKQIVTDNWSWLALNLID